MSFRIIGTGSCHPKRCVTNDQLAEFLDTSDEWISTRTGIRERRVVTDENILDLACAASEAALQNAGVKAEELDFIIFTTLQGDFISPSMSSLLTKRLGAVCTRLLDMNMACPGFIYALDVADSFFKAGKAEKGLVVSAEAMSRIVDWNDRSTCVLFGDGAGAAVLEKGEGFKEAIFTVDGGYEHINIPVWGGNSPFSAKNEQKAFLTMNGQEVYIFAVSSIVQQITKILERNGMTADEPSFYILHQANIRIIESARKKLKQPAEKFPINLDRYGNTSSSTVPMLLDELNRQGRLKKGDKLVLCGFGAGLITGTCILEW